MLKPIGEGTFNTLSAAYAVLALKSYARVVAQHPPELSIAEIDKAKKEKVLVNGHANSCNARISPATPRRFAFAPPQPSIHPAPIIRSWRRDSIAEFSDKAITDGLEVYRELLDKSNKPVTTTKLGDVITVRLHIRSVRPDSITNVALIDLLPGGFEVVSSSLSPGHLVDQGRRLRRGPGRSRNFLRHRARPRRWKSRTRSSRATAGPSSCRRCSRNRCTTGTSKGAAWAERSVSRNNFGLRNTGSRKMKTSTCANGGCEAQWFLMMALAAIWLALPKPPLLEGVDFSTRVLDRNGNILRVTLTADQKYRIWTPLKEISPALVDATLRFEDKYYGKHPGVNPVLAPPRHLESCFFRADAGRRFHDHDATGSAAGIISTRGRLRESCGRSFTRSNSNVTTRRRKFSRLI